MILRSACVALGFAMMACVAHSEQLGEQSSDIDMGYRLIVRMICPNGFSGPNQFVVTSPEWMITGNVAGETQVIASGTGYPSAEVLAEYGLSGSACSTGEAAVGAGLGYNVVWFGLAGVAVAEGAYAGYLCYQLADASCDLAAANRAAVALDSQISQPIVPCTTTCPAGTFCSPTSGSTCWTQSGRGEGCGWSVGGQEVPLSGACASGSCQANAAGSYSCQ